MSTRMIANAAVDFDADGFMTDYSQWSLEVAHALAAERGIATLTERHVAVLNSLRQEFIAHGTSPTVRRLAHHCEISTRELHKLFPGQTTINAARIAGIKKPHTTA